MSESLTNAATTKSRNSLFGELKYLMMTSKVQELKGVNEKRPVVKSLSSGTVQVLETLNLSQTKAAAVGRPRLTKLSTSLKGRRRPLEGRG